MPCRTFYSLMFCLVSLPYGWTQKVFFSGNDHNSIYVCEDGRVFMSGQNNRGELGRGSLISSNVPVELGGIDGVGSAPRCKQAQIEGVSTYLALTNSGDTVLAWGPNQFGQAGVGTIGVKTSPVIVKGVGGVGYLQNIKQIATASYTSYALTEDGKVLSWGVNTFGETGSGSFMSPVLFPTYVLKAFGDTLKNVRVLTAGGVFCLALLCDGTVWGWGNNNMGQLGQNNSINSPFAIPIKNSKGTGILNNIIKIEAGDNYAFALSATDTLWCWGANWDGRLGNGSYTPKLLPDFVRNSNGTSKLSGVIDIAAGQGHCLALLADKSVYAWGQNKDGQLGNNDSTNSTLPVRVKNASGSGFLNGVNHVAVGDSFSIARTDDNQIFIWGRNRDGQLGTNDYQSRKLPVLLNLPCEITKDTLLGLGRMENSPVECINSNAGTVTLNKYHGKILRWEQSFDNFSSYFPLANTNSVQSYSDLKRTTSYRVVLNECSNNFYSPKATIIIDSAAIPGKIDSSATVRINLNKDTLKLTGYKGMILGWEYSTDLFVSDISSINSSSSSLGYSNLSQTTYYRAIVKRGACPAVYSDTAIIRAVDHSVVKIYNGFTPDGDNYNDEWIIDFIDLFPQNRVEIYNRWGQLVYRAIAYDNESNIWRGENNVSDRQPLADGTYFYLVDLGENLPPMKGYVVIKRGDFE